MPIYEFECVGCGTRVEVIRLSVPDDPDRANPGPCGCGGEREAVVPVVSFRLKGSGFHVNDYGPPAGYSYSTDARVRMRREVADAVDSGEVPRGQNPFDSGTVREESLDMDEVYGRGARAKITGAMVRNKDKPQHDVDLGDGEAVRVTRRGETDFVLGRVPAGEEAAA